MQSTTVKPAARAMSAARRDYRIRLRQMRHDYQLYVIILLPVAWLILFHYVPMFGLQLAFKNFRITDGIWGSPWAGLGYFEKFFYSYQFTKIVGNTLIISFYELLASSASNYTGSGAQCNAPYQIQANRTVCHLHALLYFYSRNGWYDPAVLKSESRDREHGHWLIRHGRDQFHG